MIEPIANINSTVKRHYTLDRSPIPSSSRTISILFISQGRVGKRRGTPYYRTMVPTLMRAVQKIEKIIKMGADMAKGFTAVKLLKVWDSVSKNTGIYKIEFWDEV